MKKNKNGYLSLTCLKEFWNSDGLTYLMDDMCLSYSDLKKTEYKLVDSVWQEPGIQKKMDEYCEHLFEKLIGILSDFLNCVHNEIHSIAYWQFILSEWLYSYIYEWYAHYLELKMVIGQFDILEVQVLDIKKTCFPLSMEHMQNLFGQRDVEYYHLSIYSRLLKLWETNDNIIIHKKNFVCLNETSKTNDTAGRKDLKFFFKQLYNFFFKNSPILCLDLPVGDCLPELRKREVGKVLFESAIFPRSICEMDYRIDKRMNMHLNVKPENEFERILYDNILYDMPVAFIEMYKTLVEFREKKIRWNPQFMIWPGGLQEEDVVCWAKWAEEGCLFYSISHGPLDTVFAKGYRDSIFLAGCRKYGWGTVPNSHVKKCPSFKVSENKIRYEIKKKDQILWCGSGLGRQVKHLVPWEPVYRTNVDRAEAMHLILECLANMDKCIQDKLLYRPRDVAKYGMIEMFSDIIPNIRIDETVNDQEEISQEARFDLWDHMQESHLIICESLLTSVFYEALFLNIPVIVLEPDMYTSIKDTHLYPDVMQYFEELKTCGIWYLSGEEAAAFINRQYASIKDWWMEEGRQQLRKKMVDRFFMNTDDVVGWWTEEFDRLLQEIKEKEREN